MKITKDDNGKHIIDFEELEIKVDMNCACNELFDSDIVSEVRNGVWLFDESKQSVPL